MSVLQEIYDSEINATIGWFWDGGFDLAIGDDMNGYMDRGCVDTWVEVEAWFREKALEHYPDSDFGKSIGQRRLSPDVARLDKAVEKIIDEAKPA